MTSTRTLPGNDKNAGSFRRRKLYTSIIVFLLGSIVASVLIATIYSGKKTRHLETPDEVPTAVAIPSPPAGKGLIPFPATLAGTLPILAPGMYPVELVYGKGRLEGRIRNLRLIVPSDRMLAGHLFLSGAPSKATSILKALSQPRTLVMFKGKKRKTGKNKRNKKGRKGRGRGKGKKKNSEKKRKASKSAVIYI